MDNEDFSLPETDTTSDDTAQVEDPGEEGNQENAESGMAQTAIDTLSQDGPSKKEGMLFYPDEVAGEENKITSFIHITSDQISILVDGKQGLVISKDDVKISGTQKSDGLTTNEKGSLWEGNLVNMLFIPSTMATPVPDKTPRNPLEFVTQLLGINFGG